MSESRPVPSLPTARSATALAPGATPTVPTSLGSAATIPADADGDGVPDSRDTCRTTAAGTANGCPPGQPTTLKAPSPAPEPVTPVVTVAPTDPDHDGRAGAADACPTVAARTANGCPLPALRSFRVTVARHSRRATARITASGAATVALRIQRRRCHGGRCGWQSVAARTQSGAAGRARLSRQLRRGRYRATVRLRSAAGAAPRSARAFRVR